METKEQKIKMDPAVQKNCRLALPCPAGHACFFDIETTGLSPQVSSVFLIGAAWFTSDGLCLKQWFADDYISEKEILASFSLFAENFSVFVHYNGSTFDIPYLEKKYKAHGLPSPFTKKDNLDLYRAAGKRKKWFGTANMKLTTMERFLGFERKDCHTGKDCIQLYTEFMQKKYFRDNLAIDRKNQLLLHNQDDLYGTVLCSQLLHYTSYKPETPYFQLRDMTAVFSDSQKGYFPVSLTTEQDSIYYSFDVNKIEITIPLCQETLYHFYKDYKNYYYLPEEDTAVHKSVGIYVDPAHRQKATAANCYTKKTGLFLPLPKKFIPESIPLFKKERRDSLSFLLLDMKQQTEHSADSPYIQKEPALPKDLLSGFLSCLLN